MFLSIKKSVTKPVPPYSGSTLYLVPASDPKYVDAYITDKTGTTLLQFVLYADLVSAIAGVSGGNIATADPISFTYDNDLVKTMTEYIGEDVRTTTYTYNAEGKVINHVIDYLGKSTQYNYIYNNPAFDGNDFLATITTQSP